MAHTAAYATTILKPRQEVYAYWRNWQNLPKFSRHLKSVEDIGSNRTRWTTEGPRGDISWDAETTQDLPGELISWKSIGEADVSNHGHVTFKDAPGDRGTEVVATLSYDIPGGIAGEAAAKLTGTSPEAEVAETLRRFKCLLEVGELPTIEGQSSNRKRGDNQPGEESPRTGLR